MQDTETVLKLRDAASQMKLAIAHINDEETFRSCINAFLSAARSVTMVLERECKPLEMTDWYKRKTEILGKTPLFRFFNDQRVYSIHRGVVQPVRKEHEVISASFWYEQNETGKQTLAASSEIRANHLSINTRDIAAFSTDGMIWAWFFSEPQIHMPGDSGNVLRLCEDYYVCLKWFVEEWFRERHRRGNADQIPM